ncbi:acyltransferase [Primorskyibacter sp. 2E107]|uniref:acyltransferase n=1 Tax=Primorskyibacter sp. 2E107 TaxID=3403458 RepID=UPI003AF7F798
MNEVQDAPAHKLRLTRRQRLWRLIKGLLDPRAWAHLVKLVNYYNHTHVTPLRKVRFGPNPSISPTAGFSYPERIEIGARVRIGTRCIIWAGPGTGRVVIGDDVLFGPEVMITAAGYRYNDGQPVTDQASDEADVVIGNDVWLGTRVTVLPGARIGDGAIIGAHSVVRGEIPAMAVAVGSPARVVSQREISLIPGGGAA